MTDKPIERIVIDTTLSVAALTPEHKVWLCPVCGLKRNIGNHARCSKITQLKHRKERDNRSQK